MQVSRLPLNALRAFEAAARLLSFKQAAEELHVTPAALSYQIRTLEEQLDVQLFTRMNRRVALTDAGSRLYPGLHDGFSRLSSAVAQVEPARNDNILVISSGPAVSAKWLTPRLSRFLERHPEIDPRISANLQTSDFEKEEIDIALRFGGGHYPGLDTIPLLTESVTPMCSPDFEVDGRPVREIDDLKRVTLIHDESTKHLAGTPDWRSWLDAAGVEDVDPDRGLRFNHADHAIDAAVEGAGIVLGRTVLGARDLQLGRLVKPFDLELPMNYAFYLVMPKGASKRPNVAAFIEWMLEEAGQGN